jgi:predicted enzyme related to lactoylglutathione lyase
MGKKSSRLEDAGLAVADIALEVGDIEEALAFYGRLFEFELRGKSGTSARPIPRTAKGPDSTG